jgi:uncharacterized membrane protein YbaN (DUF454 family)
LSKLKINSLRRFLWNAAGGLSLVLGAIGILLPLLPTTPFILLASACFLRGSPGFHQWLLRNKYLGPVLIEWQLHRSISATVRIKGLILILASFAFSIYMVPHMWLKLALLCFLVALVSFFLRIPVKESVADRGENL